MDLGRTMMNLAGVEDTAASMMRESQARDKQARRSVTWLSGSYCLHVEAHVHDVTVLDDVVLTLDLELAGRLHVRF